MLVRSVGIYPQFINLVDHESNQIEDANPLLDAAQLEKYLAMEASLATAVQGKAKTITVNAGCLTFLDTYRQLRKHFSTNQQIDKMKMNNELQNEKFELSKNSDLEVWTYDQYAKAQRVGAPMLPVDRVEVQMKHILTNLLDPALDDKMAEFRQKFETMTWQQMLAEAQDYVNSGQAGKQKEIQARMNLATVSNNSNGNNSALSMMCSSDPMQNMLIQNQNMMMMMMMMNNSNMNTPGGASSSNPNAFLAGGGGSSSSDSRWCTFCNKPRHTDDNCFRKKKWLQQQAAAAATKGSGKSTKKGGGAQQQKGGGKNQQKAGGKPKGPAQVKGSWKGKAKGVFKKH
ncbi:unnamed protein product [Amoebophrya sp. A25]|nr:unnamed protein product [Amoebophrya sp. A25]|eukprot:GSA25T00007249001.1